MGTETPTKSRKKTTAKTHKFPQTSPRTKREKNREDINNDRQ